MTVNFLVKKLKKSLGRKENRDILEKNHRVRHVRHVISLKYFSGSKNISGETERTRFWVEARKLLRFHTREARLSSFLLLTKAFYVSLTESTFDFASRTDPDASILFLYIHVHLILII